MMNLGDELMMNNNNDEWIIINDEFASHFNSHSVKFKIVVIRKMFI